VRTAIGDWRKRAKESGVSKVSRQSIDKVLNQPG